MSDDRWWYTENEWSRLVGWGSLPKEYAKPEEVKDSKPVENKEVD